MAHNKPRRAHRTSCRPCLLIKPSLLCLRAGAPLPEQCMARGPLDFLDGFTFGTTNLRFLYMRINKSHWSGQFFLQGRASSFSFSYTQLARQRNRTYRRIAAPRRRRLRLETFVNLEWTAVVCVRWQDLPSRRSTHYQSSAFSACHLTIVRVRKWRINPGTGALLCEGPLRVTSGPSWRYYLNGRFRA